MAFNAGAFSEETTHHILLENRNRLAVSGVEEVESFDDNQIVMATCQGELIIRGENLHIEQLSLDGGELRVEGTVDALTYEAPREKGGFFARLLG
ncbi:MAG: sporulation protein YabP [Candidatus Onthomonas sp.]